MIDCSFDPKYRLDDEVIAKFRDHYVVLKIEQIDFINDYEKGGYWRYKGRTGFWANYFDEEDILRKIKD